MLHPDSEEYNTWCTNLNICNVILKKNIHEAKSLHCEQLFDKYKFKVASTWKAINEIISRHKLMHNFQHVLNKIIRHILIRLT